MSGHGGGGDRSDVLRKAAIVVVLVAGLAALYQVGRPGAEFDPTGLLALGFVILASYTVGQLFVSFGLPQLTGYLVAGMLLGPSLGQILPAAWRMAPFDQGVLNAEVLGQLKILDTLAISLIALAAGGELKAGEIRRSIGAFVAMTLSVVGIGWPVMGLALWLVMGPMGLLPVGDSLGVPLWALAMVTALVVTTNSPAVTIAVVTSTGAKGTWTQRILVTVVLLDVCVPTLFSVVAALTSPGAGEGTSLVAVLAGHLVGSMVVGVLVGIGTVLYLQYVAAELLLFLVGVIYVAAYASMTLHLEPILVFIAAGFTVANFSRHGGTLVEAVERLSLPTYVVFFTLTGAGVHLDVFMKLAVFAVPFALLRVALRWASTQVGGRIAGWPAEQLAVVGLAYVPQAGVAIGLSNLLATTYGPAGQNMAALCIAIVTLNEVVGPIVLTRVLGALKELPTGPQAAAPSESAERPNEEASASWGDDLGGIPEIRDELRGLRDRLRSWEERVAEPVDRALGEGHGLLRELRLVFHQGHRGVLSVPATERGAAGTQARTKLAAAWRRVLASRADRTVLDGPWIELIRSLDQGIDELPAWLSAEVQPASALRRPSDGVWVRTGKAIWRLRMWVAGRFGRKVWRAVPAKQLGRYHLGGLLVAELEPVVAGLLSLEIEMLQRVLPVFEAVDRGYTHAAGASNGEREALLQGVRELADRELAEVGRWMDTEAGRLHHEAEQVLVRNWSRLVEDLREVGTPAKLAWSVRLSKVHSARKLALGRLGGGIEEARGAFELYGGAVALALELREVESRIEQEVRHGARSLGRQVAARGHDRLGAIGAALDRMLQRIIGVVEGDGVAVECLSDIVAHEEPLLVAAARDTGTFRSNLKDGAAVQDLIEALLAIGGELPEKVRIPQDPWVTDQRVLPDGSRAVEVPARSVVTSWVEIDVQRELLASCEAVGERLDEVAMLLEELALLVRVNLGLVQGEIEARSEAQAVQESVRETLLLPLRRFRWRVAQLERDSAPWSDEIEARIGASVDGALAILRESAFQGRFSELRQRVLREMGVQRRKVGEAGGLVLATQEALQDAERRFVARYGLEAAARLRRTLGIPLVEGELGPESFRAAEPTVVVPAVYKRLFSAERLDVGQSMLGREADAERALRALTGGPVKGVGVVGWPGVGRQGFARRVAAEAGDAVQVLGGKHRLSEADVDAFFARVVPGDVVVIEGIERLWRPGPGGGGAAAALVRHAHRSAAPWIATGTPAGWSFAARFSAIGDLFPTRVALGPWSEADLRTQLLTRHGLSGYRVAFEGEDLEVREEEAIRQRWFARIHELSGGLFEDALRLWLGSVVRVDESYGVVVLGQSPAAPDRSLARLDDEVALVLYQLLLRGRLDAEGHGALFGTSPERSEVALMGLVHLGLVERDGDEFMLARHLVGPWVRVLTEKGWLP